MAHEDENYQRYKYEHAPLQEAIFEMRLNPVGFDNAIPGQIYEKIRHQFPEKRNFKQVIGTMGAAAELQSQLPPFGIQMPFGVHMPWVQAWNTKHSQCLQIGPGVIAANDVSYQEWEGFLPSIKILLESYFQIARPKQVDRVGIRFVNRIVIPREVVSISDFFQIGLVLPTIIKNSHAFDIIIHSKAERELCTKVRFATDSLRNGENGVAFLLDIDASISQMLPTDIEGTIEVAQSAHRRIGAIFEGLLLPATRQLLGGKLVC